MSLLPVGPNPRSRPSATEPSCIILNGHISETVHLIQFAFGSMVKVKQKIMLCLTDSQHGARRPPGLPECGTAYGKLIWVPCLQVLGRALSRASRPLKRASPIGFLSMHARLLLQPRYYCQLPRDQDFRSLNYYGSDFISGSIRNTLASREQSQIAAV